MHKYVLIPGRHHVVTRFQTDYIEKLIQGEVDSYGERSRIQLDEHPIFVWAITSANHANTRRNPIPGDRRLGMIEHVMACESYESLTFRITNMEPKPDFAHYLIEEINLQSRGNVVLTPENCIVATSTPDVIKQYADLGFSIAPLELDYDVERFTTPRAWDIVERIIDREKWQSDEHIQKYMHPESLRYYERYNLADLIVDTFSDPLALDDGDITDTRDYETYRAAFEDNAFRKVGEFIDVVEPGRILDIGCASGQTMKLLSDEPRLFESDFYGVEIARPLYQICENRKANGEFGLSNVFFYQRNIMNSDFFENNSLNTVITMALTHEIESYMGHEHLLQFIKKIYDMLAPGGVYINYDVSGPSVLDDTVYVVFNEADGENPDGVDQEISGDVLRDFLTKLSSKARFRRFTRDFRREEEDTIHPKTETVDRTEYYVLKWSELCEFLAKKDYVDSWQSEMHEKFCFWNIDNWKQELEKVGFTIEHTSRPIRNEWLIENRFSGTAKVYRKNQEGDLTEMPQPDTNMLIVARKPI